MTGLFNRVEQAIHDLKQGKMVIVVDDEARENEGDIIFPAQTITPEVMNFMIRHCSGIICLCLTEDKVKQLDLPLMVSGDKNNSRFGTGFTVSIEAATGVTTGVSAHDRTRTVQAAIADDATPSDLARPGHVFPLQAKENGVLVRAGHTEGSIDLVRMAGFSDAAVLCEIMNPDGTMAKGEQLTAFASQHELSIVSIEELINYRLHHETFITETSSANLPIDDLGEFTITVVKDKLTNSEHVVLSKPTQTVSDTTLVRIHSSCMTGDLFASLRCDCGQQLQYSLQRISEEGGVLIYLQQEGRGIGLFNKIKAYALQEQGLDTVEANHELGFPADNRDYTIAANMLKHLAVSNVRLLTNSSSKITSLQSYPYLNVTREAMPIFKNAHNAAYITTKQEKLNHLVVE